MKEAIILIEAMAHRGASIAFPENTLPAFEEAVRVKADGIELDVHFSKDHELIVMHDEKIDRTTDGTGQIRHYTLEELKRFNAGAHFKGEPIVTQIPTLQEVFQLLKERNYQGTLNIELKTDYFTYEGIEKKVADFVDHQDIPFKIIYSSFSLKSLWQMSLVSPKSKLNYLFGDEVEKGELTEKLDFLEGLHPCYQFLSTAKDKINTFDKKIRIWTIDDEAMIRECLKQPIHTIITDDPALVMKIRDEKKV